jgi:hypothetical protein
MSGYFSRIVQTAKRTSQPLRPLAGSIFGAPAERERTRPSYLNDTPFVTESEVPETPASFAENYEPLQPSRLPLARPFPQPFQDRPDPFESPLAAHEYQQSQEIPPRVTPRADSITTRAEDKHAFAPRITRSSETVREQSTADSAQFDSNAAKSVKSRLEPAESEEGAQSIANHQASMAAPQVLIPTQPGFNQPTHAARPQQLPIREQRAQEPSIEIHIGRIEVLAVQPPAPPAPAPRRDRSTSLSDYLAGQNGRRS